MAPLARSAATRKASAGTQRDLDGAAGPVGGDAEGLGGFVEREPVGDERAGDVLVGGEHGGDLIDLTNPVVTAVRHGADPDDLLDERRDTGDGNEPVVHAEQDHAPAGPDQL
jgi:hypothetical protein